MIKTTGIAREIKRIYKLPDLIDFEMLRWSIGRQGMCSPKPEGIHRRVREH